MAHIIGFASFKGGTGKTTLAHSMAERGHASGLRTLLLDFDPQETAIGVAYLRQEPGWEVRRCQVSVAGAEELNDVAGSRDDDVVVCDLPGSEGATLQGVLASMDLVLCPVGLGAPDCWSPATLRGSPGGCRYRWFSSATICRRTAATRGVDTGAGGDGTARVPSASAVSRCAPRRHESGSERFGMGSQ